MMAGRRAFAPALARCPALVPALALALAAGMAACAHQPRGPAETLAGFGAAVDRKDYPAAYALMSADYRRRVPLADFRAQLEAGGADAQEVARRLAATAARTPMRIEVEADLGETLALIMDAGEWRVDGPLFELYGQRTPRAALRSFLRAIERGRYDVAVRLVPNRYRLGVTADKLRDYWEGDKKVENQKLLQALRSNVNAAIVEVGDEARMPYGESAEVRFVREDGLWKIEDPD